MSVPAPPPVPVMPQAPLPTQPQVNPDELPAVTKVVWFTVIQLAGIVAGWALGFYVFGTVFASASSLNLPPNPTPDQVSAALGPFFQSLTFVLPIDILIQVAALLVLTFAFRQLRKVDHQRFSIPSIFMIVMIVGVVLATVGLIPFVNGIPSIIAQAGANPGTPSPAFTALMASFLAAFAFIALGGLLAFIGLIGGQILGLWRVGSRYDETLIKIGAIFTIIPLLNIVAPILVLVGAYQVKGRLQVQRQ